jgi:hypothetical protein
MLLILYKGSKIMKNITYVAFAALLTMAPSVNASLLSVLEVNDFEKVYSLDIPTESNYNGNAPIYAIDNSAENFGFVDRVAYYMELDGNWVWASFDTLTQDLSRTGVPIGFSWKQRISNLSIESNVTGVTTGLFSEGYIEFFDNCYSTAQTDGGLGGSDTLYDVDDVISANTPNCYGSMQLHNYMGNETIFSYNSWEYSSSADDLGIGTSTGDHPDWTFANNASAYQSRKLEVFVSSQEFRTARVLEVSTPSTLSLFGIALLALMNNRRKK